MQNSKLIVCAAVAANAIISIGAASAADLPARTYTKAPVMVDPGYNWTGFYVGGSLGGKWSQSTWTTDVSSFPLDPSTNGQKLNASSIE
jgi:outer membrane immunogenic protein